MSRQGQESLAFMDLISCTLGAVLLLFLIFSSILSGQTVYVREVILTVRLDRLPGQQDADFPALVIAQPDLSLRYEIDLGKTPPTNLPDRYASQIDLIAAASEFAIVCRIPLDPDHEVSVSVVPKEWPREVQRFSALLTGMKNAGEDPVGTGAPTCRLVDLSNELLEFAQGSSALPEGVVAEVASITGALRPPLDASLSSIERVRIVASIGELLHSRDNDPAFQPEKYRLLAICACAMRIRGSSEHQADARALEESLVERLTDRGRTSALLAWTVRDYLQFRLGKEARDLITQLDRKLESRRPDAQGRSEGERLYRLIRGMNQSNQDLDAILAEFDPQNATTAYVAASFCAKTSYACQVRVFWGSHSAASRRAVLSQERSRGHSAIQFSIEGLVPRRPQRDSEP